jgi:glucose-1-phosphate cytidylyltransferase
MQVVILCGGKGVRIREVSEDLPKPMLPIGERPILWHIMSWYASFGFKDFVLCAGYKSGVIKQFFLDYDLLFSDFKLSLGARDTVKILNRHSHEDWQVTIAETGLETMTGGRLQRVGRYLRGEQFMLTYGDGLADVDLTALLEHHSQHGKLGTVTAVAPAGRFGELEMQGTTVTDFSEKPVTSRGLINGGYLVFQRAFLDRLPANDALILEQEPLRELARDGELSAYIHRGFWQCMDNSRDFQHLNSLWNAGDAPWIPAVEANSLTYRRAA